MITSKHIKNLINQITKTLGLTFVADQNSEDNVCFANAKELRDDYKTTFTSYDLLGFVYLVLQSTKNSEKYKLEFDSLPFLKDTETFWDSVKLGNDLRQTHLLERGIENNITID